MSHPFPAHLEECLCMARVDDFDCIARGSSGVQTTKIVRQITATARGGTGKQPRHTSARSRVIHYARSSLTVDVVVSSSLLLLLLLLVVGHCVWVWADEWGCGRCSRAVCCVVQSRNVCCVRVCVENG